MRHIKLVLDVPTSVAAGAAKPVQDLQTKWAAVSGTFSATLVIEVSMDNATWFTVASGITAPGLHEIPQSVAFARVRATAFASGTPEVVIAGYMSDG